MCCFNGFDLSAIEAALVFKTIVLQTIQIKQNSTIDTIH
ncbi:hypothetical protein BB14905_01065 [Bacillus sp. B14905]|nr:hypothetical protein BB14905_01065 [Bacillus sp. B14905]